MKNLLWTIALIAALSFVFVACGDDGDPGEVDKTLTAVYIDAPTEGAWTGVELTATITPTAAEVTYQWSVKGGSDVTGATSSKFTPTDPGWYTVTATDADEVTIKTDDILVGPGELKGEWYMNATSQTQIGVAAPTYNETVTITNDGYLLVASTAATGLPDGDGYKFAISDWEKGSFNISIGTGTGFSTFVGTKFPTTFKVSGKFEDVHGYNTGNSVGTAPFPDTYLYIRFNPSDKQFFRSNPANTYTGTGGLPAVERLFEQEKKGTWATAN
jgi:hypothetical protein